MAAKQRVADVLRKVREDRGVSLRSAARDLGVDASYLSRVESGERPLTSKMRDRVESLYGVHSDVLHLAAGVAPPDVVELLQQHPELLDEIRDRYEQRS